MTDSLATHTPDPVNVHFLLEAMRAQGNDYDVDLVLRAYAFAEAAHEGQVRLSGEPFISHPMAIAEILASLGMDTASIAAGLLHDVVEDCDVELETIRQEFGATIATLVDGVTKLTQIDYETVQERQNETLRKMFLAMAQDLRVIIIKLADRLHNLRTLHPFSEERQRAVARETMDIFAPLAHRLGIGRIKWELEDLAFKYLYPREYRDIARRVSATREKREELIAATVTQLKEALLAQGIESEVTGRAKHLWSIYQKMQRQRLDFAEIYDLTAFRVIVNDIGQCYAALGIVQNLWPPIPDMFTDHIATPKPNGYRSLHTKVYGRDQTPMEVQIRTWDMHREAEFGVAAHWQYKERGDGKPNIEDRIGWLHMLDQMGRDLKDASEFLRSVRFDLFLAQVFVMTPRGDVVDLPAGSTPVDFAYRIHTEVGDHCAGARVNGRLARLDSELRSGDICEIITQPTKWPSWEWLDFVKSAHARACIRRHLRRQNFEDNRRHGRTRLAKRARAARLDLTECVREGCVDQVAAALRLNSADDLFARVGFGDINPDGVIERLQRLVRAAEEGERRAAMAADLPARHLHGEQGREGIGVTAPGAEGKMFRLSKCCSPVPGDAIIGYVTRGRGIAVHRRSCKNVQHLGETDGTRLMDVMWTNQEHTTYQARLNVEAFDRPGLLHDVTAVISEQEINISEAQVAVGKDGTAHISLVVDVPDAAALTDIVNKLTAMKDVGTVRRQYAKRPPQSPKKPSPRPSRRRRSDSAAPPPQAVAGR